jgi:3-polyprenyl-4-hydroxybenzoate decarboxylase
MFFHDMVGYYFHRIRKIIARIRKMMMSHYPIVHAILLQNPKITIITAIMKKTGKLTIRQR